MESEDATLDTIVSMISAKFGWNWLRSLVVIAILSVNWNTAKPEHHQTDCDEI
jgi:hypothetical protein